MRRIIDSAITDTKLLVNAEFVDTDNAKFKARFNALLAQADPKAQPDSVSRNGAKPSANPITPDQMRGLETAEQIALVTKFLLTPGNQKQVIKQTDGLSILRSKYIRSDYITNASDSQKAAKAIIAGGGNCGEHALVAFEIAKELGIPVARYSDRDVDHAYVALYPKSADPIIIDAWTDIPTVCLASDYELKNPCVTEKLQTEWNGVIDHSFNLDRILQIKEKVTDQLGENGIDNTLKEEARKERGIRSKTLDRIMKNQGVNSYIAITQDNLSEKDRTEVTRKLQKVDTKLGNKLKKEAERWIVPHGNHPVEHNTKVDYVKESTDPNNTALAQNAAKDAALKEATEYAKWTAYNLARASALKKIIPESTKTAMYTRTAIGIADDAQVNVTVTATTKVSVKSGLWNASTNTNRHTYSATNGTERTFNRAPAGHHENLANANEKTFPVFNNLNRFKAKIGYSSRDLKLIKKNFADFFNKAPNDAELQNNVDQHMVKLSQNLAQSNIEPRTLSEIELRINDVSPLTLDQTLVSLSATLPRLANNDLAHGTRILRQWLNQTSTAGSHSKAIEQLVVGWKSCFCNDQEASKEKEIRTILDRYTPPNYLALQAAELLSTTHVPATQTKAIRFIVDRLYKVSSAEELNNTMHVVLNQLQTLTNDNLKTILGTIQTIPPRMATSNAQAYVNTLTKWISDRVTS